MKRGGGCRVTVVWSLLQGTYFCFSMSTRPVWYSICELSRRRGDSREWMLLECTNQTTEVPPHLPLWCLEPHMSPYKSQCCYGILSLQDHCTFRLRTGFALLVHPGVLSIEGQWEPTASCKSASSKQVLFGRMQDFLWGFSWLLFTKDILSPSVELVKSG